MYHSFFLLYFAGIMVVYLMPSASQTKKYKNLLKKYQQVRKALKSYHRNAQVITSSRASASERKRPPSLVHYPKDYFLIHKN
jgi:hypothetical protein